MVLTDQVIAGRYQLGKLLGSGGFGAVYLAEDLRLRRSVAIKVCSTQRLPADEAAEAARLFEGEALTLARLRHPGLTAVWDYFNAGDDWFLVMEYVPGESLREVLKRSGGRLPVEQAIDYAGQLCDVLRYLHTQPDPIVFRDLKPGNIMVTPQGELKLIDFGIARLFTPGKTSDTVQMGTPGYAPPEQYGGQTTPRSDIYSLGAVTHQMLTGHNPGASPFALPPARAVNPALSAQVEVTLMRALAPEPANRFPTAQDFCAALRAAVSGSQSVPTAPADPTIPIAPPARLAPTSQQPWTPQARALPQQPRQSGAGRGLVVVALLFILVASLGAGVWMLRDQIPRLVQGIGAPAAPTASGLSLPGVVAYVAPGPEGGNDLFIREGTQVRRLTTNPKGVSAALPAISPNGKRIAYGVNEGSTEALWIINVDGTGRSRLLEQYAVARAPAWAPKRDDQLAVEVAAPGKEFVQHDIVLLNLQTDAVTPLVNSGAWEGAPSWSPDGKSIAFNGRIGGSQCMRLYMQSIAGSEPRQLTAPPSGAACVKSQGDFWPTWSPDGKRIAFGRKYKIPECAVGECVAVLTVASGEMEFWSTGKPAGRPRWSPNGQYLLFEEKDPDKGTILQRLDLQTGKFKPLDPGQPGALADWR
jgi:hypothetical protein